MGMTLSTWTMRVRDDATTLNERAKKNNLGRCSMELKQKGVCNVQKMPYNQ